MEQHISDGYSLYFIVEWMVMLGASYGNFRVNEVFHLVFVQEYKIEFLAMWSSHVHVHTRDHSRHRNKEKFFFSKMHFKSSISIWITWKMWTFCLYCMMWSRNPERLKTWSNLSLHFSTLKKLQKNNDIIWCSPVFQVLYYIWHIWAAVFFEYDRPEMWEGGAIEWRVEINGLKQRRTGVPQRF